uniref:Uncharacterized protein n=1 Tax=Anopheles coluzzii TaxID=1518534 RepID=A0A8W7PIN6_ANOCL
MNNTGWGQLLEYGRPLLELLPPQDAFLLHAAPLFLLLPDLVVELVGAQLLLDLCLEETLRPPNAHLVHVDLGEAGELTKPRVGHELTGACFAPEVGLRGAQLFHHDLQLGQIEIAIVADVIPVAWNELSPTGLGEGQISPEPSITAWGDWFAMKDLLGNLNRCLALTLSVAKYPQLNRFAVGTVHLAPQYAAIGVGDQITSTNRPRYRVFAVEM